MDSALKILMNMEKYSSGLLLWKDKLDDIVNLASLLQPEDQKVAAEIWFAALRQIQTLWSKAQSNEQSTDESLEDGKSLSRKSAKREKPGKAVHTSNDNGNASSTKQTNERNGQKKSKDKRKGVFQRPTSTKKIKQEQEDVDESPEFDVQNIKTIIKKEEISAEEDAQPGETEIKSVHLMISADPVLVPDMSKYKRVQRNNSTGKTETTYQCEKCPKQYRTAVALYKHRATHTKGFECQICHQRLSNRHALSAHKRTHTGERPYECTKCPARFTTRGNLVRHVASHDGERPWQCAICGKRYTEKKSLKVHMRTHTGEKPYACSVCPKRFSQSGVLQAHMLIHTNQYAHLCDICGRSFRQRSQLITHHLRHEGVRPFTCTECERKFTTKGDMERHMRTHTGERPYHCDVCGSSFARPQTLLEHKNRHYNFKPYVCKVCGKGFHEMAACSRHVKGQHGKEPASASIVRLNSQSQQEEENGNEEEEEEDVDNEDEDTEDVETEKADEDIKHQIFVMQTGDSEETKLITIAEHGDGLNRPDSAVTCDGCGTMLSSLSLLKAHARQCKSPQVRVSVAEWLVAGGTGSPSDSMEITVGSEGSTVGDLECVEDESASLGCVEGPDNSLGCVEEVDSTDLSHAVTISEDGSITSVPLSQLAPLHLQLENDYMVVLNNGSRTSYV